jgi:hypothetical protein
MRLRRSAEARAGSLSIRQWLIAIILSLGFFGCSPIKHDEDLAKKRALEFAELVLVKHNVEQGYAQLSDAAKHYVSAEKFRETISRLHPDGYPTRITVTGYKPIFNEKAVYIFLSGQSADKQFQYILTLEGTAASDYRVAVIIRTS